MMTDSKNGIKSPKLLTSVAHFLPEIVGYCKNKNKKKHVFSEGAILCFSFISIKTYSSRGFL
jgi:hypothetical protein